jgi:hypothetical protein
MGPNAGLDALEKKILHRRESNPGRLTIPSELSRLLGSSQYSLYFPINSICALWASNMSVAPYEMHMREPVLDVTSYIRPAV